MSWYLKALKNYMGFRGRARRTEFWVFYLYDQVIGSTLLIAAFAADSIALFVLYLVYEIGTILPFMAVTVRRLHDFDLSGWWWLFFFVPISGLIVLIVFMSLAGTAGPNKYGPDPRTASAM